MKTAEFGRPAAALPQPGVCRICRCTEHRACLIETLGIDDPGKRPCGWADQTRTLCDNPDCIAEAKRELGLGGERFQNRAGQPVRSERCTGCGVPDGHLHSGACVQSRGPTSFFRADRP